jgi:hypothetical protein
MAWPDSIIALSQVQDLPISQYNFILPWSMQLSRSRIIQGRHHRPISGALSWAIECDCEFCFSSCKSLTSVTFESDTKLQRIDESAIAESGLRAMQIPASVEMLSKNGFSECISLASVTFQVNSQLHRTEDFGIA